MSCAAQFDRLGELIRRLSALPGTTSVSLTSKRYPRMFHAEEGVGYEERVWEFSTSEARVPDEVRRADEVIVTFSGSLGGEQTKGDLLYSVSRVLNESPDDAGPTWDYRVSVPDSVVTPNRYELTLFAAYLPPDESLGAEPRPMYQ